jgi:hypothetical protein
VSGGACCTCSNTPQLYSGFYSEPFPTFDYADEAAWLAGIAAKTAEMEEKATALGATLTSNGYICANTPTAVLVSYPEFDIPNGIWGRLEVVGFRITATCCGSVDTSGTQLESDGFPITVEGNPAYPCVGPYTYDVCTDGVGAEDCCGVHRPGQTCADEPCAGCSGSCDEENPCPEGCVCVDGQCGEPCYFVNTTYYGCQVAYNACACCFDIYELDADALIAAMQAFATGALSDAFQSRGFTVGNYAPWTVSRGTISAYTSSDGVTCFPQEVECEAEVGIPESGSMCLYCDGVIVYDASLDPLPTEEFNADATEISEECVCPFANVAMADPYYGGEYLKCVPCGGACDEENPCPQAALDYGVPYECVCVDGECVRVLVGNPFP